MASLPIAVQLYSVRQDANVDLHETLKKVKAMGYDGVEFAGLCGCAPSDIKKWCDELELNPISAHVPFNDMILNPLGVLGQYKEIGCKYVTIPYMVNEHRVEHPNFQYMLEPIKAICKAAKALGMQMLYHNHDFEFTKVNDKYALDILYGSISEDLLKTELDTCWVNVGGENPAEYITKYSNRAPIVHLKDFVGGKTDNMYALIGIKDDGKTAEATQFELRPVGSGVQNFPAILEAAKAAGTEWVVVEQDTPTMGLTAFESIEKSINYLKSFEW